MRARIIIALGLVGLSLSLVSHPGLAGMPQWPQELQGPSLYGLQPWVYTIWEWNEAGTDVCYSGIPQLGACRGL